MSYALLRGDSLGWEAFMSLPSFAGALTTMNENSGYEAATIIFGEVMFLNFEPIRDSVC